MRPCGSTGLGAGSADLKSGSANRRSDCTVPLRTALLLRGCPSIRMEASEPRAECDELLAVVQRAVGDDAAQRCTAALRAQGVGAVVDWFVLETADEDLCRDLLSDVAAAEKLSRVQVAKLRLALRGQSARFYPARLSDEEGERRPLWSSFRRYTLPNPLEVAFVFTNRPGWYRAVFDALDGHRLREAYMEQSQIFMLVSARHQCHIIFSERLTATA